MTQGTKSSTVTADALEKISKKWWVAFEKPESPADGDQDVLDWATRTQVAKLDDAAAEWPVVDLPLVQSVVAIFAEGHEVPYIEAVLTPQRPTLPPVRGDGPNVTLVDVESIKDTLARGLPWPDFHVYGTFKPEGQPGAGARDGTILIEVPDDGPYKLIHNGVIGLAPQEHREPKGVGLAAGHLTHQIGDVAGRTVGQLLRPAVFRIPAGRAEPIGDRLLAGLPPLGNRQGRQRDGRHV